MGWVGKYGDFIWFHNLFCQFCQFWTEFESNQWGSMDSAKEWEIFVACLGVSIYWA
jgi:hypothetical protein